jgi:hypothetical protein
LLGFGQRLLSLVYAKGQYSDLAVPLTEEYIAEMIREYQKLFENPDNVGCNGNEKFLIGDAYWNFVAPREKLLNTIAANYDAPGENTGLEKLTDLDMTNGTGFLSDKGRKNRNIVKYAVL